MRKIGLTTLLLCAGVYLALASWPGATGPRVVSAVLTIHQAGTVTGAPSISASFIDTLLCKYHSPVCTAGQAQAIYDYGVTYGIDPAFALAFFMNESTFGTRGVARYSMSIGNLRCIPGAACIGGYAYFPSWSAGIKAWYALIAGPLYVGAGLVTVEQIIPRYAPNSDNNNEAHYIQVVTSTVALWRAGKLEIPA